MFSTPSRISKLFDDLTHEISFTDLDKKLKSISVHWQPISTPIGETVNYFTKVDSLTIPQEIIIIGHIDNVVTLASVMQRDATDYNNVLNDALRNSENFTEISTQSDGGEKFFIINSYPTNFILVLAFNTHGQGEYNLSISKQ